MTPENIEKLKAAIKRRDEAQAEIDELSKSLPWKNRCAAVRQVLGLCPQCGGQRDGDKFYCASCRSIMSGHANRRAQQKRNPQFKQYNNDNH